MVAAAATAVGINMTFLLPYSMLRKGWDKDFRGLAIFDLSIGLFIPFVLATSCVLIAAASQFHARPEAGLIHIHQVETKLDEKGKNVLLTVNGEEKKVSTKLTGTYEGNLKKLLAKTQAEKFNSVKIEDAKLKSYEKSLGELLKADGIKSWAMATADQKTAINGKLSADDKATATLVAQRNTLHRDMMAALPESDRVIAATLIKRDAFALADSLQALSKGGGGFTQILFGLGVVGMAISTIIILMLINGFTVCEMANQPSNNALHRIGAFIPGFTGAFGALFLWSTGAKFYLAVPTSKFGMLLLPIAYITFFFLMNNKSILGDSLPKGRARIIWNVLMLGGVIFACGGAGLSIWSETGKIPGTEILVRNVALGFFALMAVLAVVIHFVRPPVKHVPASEGATASTEGEAE